MSDQSMATGGDGKKFEWWDVGWSPQTLRWAWEGEQLKAPGPKEDGSRAIVPFSLFQEAVGQQ